MTKGLVTAAVFVALIAGYFLAQAGSLEPPGPPAPTMVSLSEISAQLASLSSSSVFRFVAATAAVTDGTAGFKGMNDMCVTEFAGTYPSVRMCFSEDLIKTSPASWPAFSAAWVHPSIVAVSDTQFVDISGLSSTDPSDLSCDGWRDGNATDSGLAFSILFGNSYALPTCSSPLQVACCTVPDEI